MYSEMQRSRSQYSFMNKNVVMRGCRNRDRQVRRGSRRRGHRKKDTLSKGSSRGPSR